MTQLTVTGPYTAKDQVKANRATKFIGCGSIRSSTNRYMHDFGALANSGEYTRHDIVFISAEGLRNGRLLPDFAEINCALMAGATIITDAPIERIRPYNIGEEGSRMKQGFQAMDSQDTDNLVIEHLKRFQAGQERIERKLEEITRRLANLEGGQASIIQHIGQHLGVLPLVQITESIAEFL